MVKSQPSARPSRPSEGAGAALHFVLALLANAAGMRGLCPAQPWLTLAHVQSPPGCAPWLRILRAAKIHRSDSLPWPQLMSKVCPASRIGREVRSLK